MMLEGDPENTGDGVRNCNDPFWGDISKGCLDPALKNPARASEDCDDAHRVSHAPNRLPSATDRLASSPGRPLVSAPRRPWEQWVNGLSALVYAYCGLPGMTRALSDIASAGWFVPVSPWAVTNNSSNAANMKLQTCVRVLTLAVARGEPATGGWFDTPAVLECGPADSSGDVVPVGRRMREIFADC